MNIKQLKYNIVIPTLKSIGLFSEAAINIIMGTAYQESGGGYYIHQINGPALGIYQMEPNTYNEIIDWYRSNNQDILFKVLDLTEYDRIPLPERLMYDIQYATAMCRLYYYHINTPLPDSNDIESIAKYWKKYYNTKKGKGTVEQFITNYEKYNVI